MIRGQGEDVSRMYSDFAPFPGRFIRLLEEQNKKKQDKFTSAAKTYEFNHGSGYRFARKRLGSHCPPADSPVRILDIGCGTGEKAIYYAYAFPNGHVTAIDFSQKSIDYAKRLKEHLNIDNIDFAVMDFASKDAATLGAHDVVQCSGALHHMEDPENALLKMTKLLEQNGLLWLFLYANYGNRHLEGTLRRGLHSLVPDNAKLRDRVDLMRSLDIGRGFSLGTTTVTLIERIKKQVAPFVGKWRPKAEYREYTRKGEADLYDGFAHPIVTYYTCQEIRELAEKSSLQLVNYELSPQRNYYHEVLGPLIADLPHLEQLEVVECFHYPDDYQLLFKKP